ncbi:MAG TPA: hypothetical protein VNX67_05280 [Solirubrobacteraceae bacterium]|jgi:hypothetical protein|nr:hypothetical protein [Solirubrobacteraceae bacterium]
MKDLTHTGHGLGRRADALCVTTATLGALASAFGLTDWLPLPVERIGVIADIGAGAFAACHAIRHRMTVTSVTTTSNTDKGETS